MRVQGKTKYTMSFFDRINPYSAKTILDGKILQVKITFSGNIKVYYNSELINLTPPTLGGKLVRQASLKLNEHRVKIVNPAALIAAKPMIFVGDNRQCWLDKTAG